MENGSPSTTRVYILRTGYHRPSEFGKQISLQHHCLENKLPATTRVWKTGYHPPSEFGKQISLHHQCMENKLSATTRVWKNGSPFRHRSMENRCPSTARVWKTLVRAFRSLIIFSEVVDTLLADDLGWLG
jgi:hypothetical protein